MLTPTQLSTLKAAILADPTLANQPQGSDGAFAIAALLNQIAVPDFFVWKSFVSQDEVMLNGFDWTRVDNLSVGKARIWEWMFQNTGGIDASKSNIRAGIDAVWVGTASDLAVRAVVYSHCQRQATRAEKLFATGTGTTVTNGTGPATMGFEGQLSYQDVLSARES